MRNYIALGALSLVASALLIGCGSTSDSTSTTDTETGYFIDSPVEGLLYTTTSGLTGTTDSLGKFQYKKGEKVRFSLGRLDFGEAEPTEDGLVSPRELTQNQDRLILMLRTLQALDVDNNTSNGITIPLSVQIALENISDDISMSDLLESGNILDIATALAEVLDEDYDGEIDVNATVARLHFIENLTKWDLGKRPSGERRDHRKGTKKFDLSDYPESNLTQDVTDSLAYMANEERLAYDIYTVLYDYHNDADTTLSQLSRIPKSEQRHVEIVQSLIQRYDINADNNISFEDMPTGQYGITTIQDLYNDLYAKGIISPQAALEVGCMVEVVDVDDLDKYIVQAEESNATDVVAAFNVLRDGSYKHYWAFDKGLKNMGIAEGCATLGEEWAKTTDEYPRHSHGGHGHR